MDQVISYELLVIGSGPGGYTAAVKAAKLGMTVAVIEKEETGGTYTNQGCLPVKAMLHSAMLYEEIQQGSQFGIHAQQVRMDFAGMKEYREQVASSYREKIRKEFEQWKIPLYHGFARIHDGHLVSVTASQEPGENRTEPALQPRAEYEKKEKIWLHGEKILIATGARPADFPKGGMDLPGVFTSRSLLKEDNWSFKSVIIIGGGLVGTEFATVFHTMGIHVTVLERADHLMPAMDEEISGYIRKNMTSHGMDIHTGIQVTGFSRFGEGLLCAYQEMGRRREVYAERILVAAGRRACMDGLFDEELLPQLKLSNGAPVVRGDFQTSIPGIYAVGDVLQRTQMAHTAAAQATYLVESLSGLQPTLLLSIVPAGMYVNLPIIPSCIYTGPEIASVGLTQAQAQRAGCQIRCGVCSLEDNSQAMIARQKNGFIKLIFALPGKILIGAQIVCPRATDMIGEMATAIANGLTARKLMLAMRAHPTYGEGIARAVENSGLLE